MRRTVLVATGDEASREVAMRCLDARRYRYMVAGTGRAALAALTAVPLDLLLLDTHIREVDANAVVRAMKMDAGLHRIPILLLGDTTQYELAALRTPFSEDELGAAVIAMIGPGDSRTGTPISLSRDLTAAMAVATKTGKPSS